MHIESFVRLLIAEPSNRNRQEILHTLRNAQYESEFTIAENLEDFRYALDTNRYDLIICGLQLDGTSWNQLLEIARENTPETPFVLISESYKRELVEEATRSGVNDIIAESQMKQLATVLNQQRNVAGQHSYPEETARLAQMSHELRTPLSSMIVLSKLLSENRDGNLNAKQIEYLNVIRYTGNSLLEILNDTLSLAKRENEMRLLNRRAVNLHDLCNNVYQLFRPTAQKSGVTLNLELEPNLPDKIVTDQMRLEQILRNLLSNAVKFTHLQGDVELRVSRTGPEQNPDNSRPAGNLLHFSVRDTGIGIHKEKQKSIFNSFEQAGSEISHTYGGTGLGLAISSNLARLLGGEITLESEPGKGSCFTLCVPVDIPESPSGFTPASRPAPYRAYPTTREDVQSQYRNPYLTVNEEGVPYHPSGTTANQEKKEGEFRARNLLLVDDNKMHTAALKEYLQDVAEKIYRASSAEETLNRLEEANVTCIVLDMRLQDRTGYELMKELKSTEEFHHIPVIIYTGQSLSRPDENRILQFAKTIVYKNVNSYQLLKKEILDVMK
ncbi:MAG: ATP-binding protein [Balneolaceae bacterium]